jgi:hypothetical protein
VFFYPSAAGTFRGDLLLRAGGKTSLGHPYDRTVRIPVTGNATAAVIRLLTRAPIPSDFVAPEGLVGIIVDGVPREIRRPPTGRPLPVARETPQTSVTIDIGTIQPPLNNAAGVFVLNLGTRELEIPTVLGFFATPVTGQAFPLRIAPGQWAEVRFDVGVYTGSGVGAFAETVRILSNDPITPEANVVVRGAVGGSSGAIRPEYIDFAAVAVNTAVQRSTAFQNLGTTDLHVEKLAWRNATDFRLVQPPTLPYLVPAGQSLTLNVEFGPVGAPGFHGDYFVLRTREGVVANLGTRAQTA